MSLQSGNETEKSDRGLTPRAAAYRCNRLLSMLPGLALHRYNFVFQPIEGVPKPLHQFEPHCFEADDMALAALWPDQAVRDFRFSQGARCLVVKAGGRLAGGIWFADGRFAEDEVRAVYHFADSISWDFGLFIHPDFRGTRAFAGLWGAAGADLAGRGKSGSLSRIADHLASSLLAHHRMSAKSIGHAIFLKCGLKQFCWSNGHFERQDMASCPQFHFDRMGPA
jgi:hypothetical protein